MIFILLVKAEKRFIEEAHHEIPGTQCKFGLHLFHNFYRRQGLSCQKVTCVKAKTLLSSVLILRGYFKYFRLLIQDALPIKYGKTDHGEEGRFLMDCRFNKDEVPFRFGSSCKSLNPVGSGI